ncbi:MAG: hypothetical protein H6740_27720 [Alphaproteobacteria bacterium]|nr:hypothetical protein [Alphaproteobacteria bacterium]
MVLLTPALFDCAPTSPKGVARPARTSSSAVTLSARPAFVSPVLSARAERGARAAA